MADEHSHQQQHHHNPSEPTIFDDLKRRQSILLTLFDLGSKEALNEARQAPAPSKDYCQLILTFHHVIFRRWKITLHTDSESRCPREVRDTYDDFRYDENTQREIAHVFGKPMLNYLLNITEKGKLDYLSRLPTNLIIKIISFLNLEDIARISQVSSQFRQLCKSDSVWMELYKTYYSNEITNDLMRLAERDGWRKVFFTNKIKLQLELRRQKKQKPKTKSRNYSRVQRDEKFDTDNDDADEDDLIQTGMNNRFRRSLFLTEN